MSLSISKPLNITDRILLGLLPWAVQLLYLPLNHLQSGGVAPALPVDALIPLRPLWTIPYMLTLPAWVGVALWAVWKLDARAYRAFILAELICALTGISTFYFFPTYVVRPQVGQAEGSMRLIAWLYQSDNVYNALPSGHAYLSGLYMFFLNRRLPRLRPMWISAYIIILLSTLFTRQHYILDLLAGFTLALLAYLLSISIFCRARS